MICAFCIQNVLESGRTWGNHKQSLLDLESTQDCTFCSLLHRDAQKSTGKDWPLHHWSLARLTRIREGPDAVLITFRPILSHSNIDNETRNLQAGERLPERRFYLFPEKELSDRRSAREFGRTTALQHSGTQIKDWVKKCNGGHKSCQRYQNKKPFLPTRLLDISSPSATRIRVIETKKSEGIKGPYVTLSHCWGTPNFTPTRLTLQNKIEFTTEGVPLVDLPENFKQAIEVGQFLGLQYIWIDSLCIIQGDGGDFLQEAPLMHQIYRNSYCNIAAADSKDGTGGLFRDRMAHDVLPTRYQADGKSPFFGNQTWLVISKDLWEYELLSTHVYSRAWVFQERMLSPRLLHFAKHQVFWDCTTVSACEAFPSGLPQPLDEIAGTDRYWRASLQNPSSLRQQTLVGPADYSLEQFWKNAVLHYTSCDLTNGNDKLIALWGVAKLLRDGLGENYGAGLWEGNLEEQLAWRISKCELQDRPQELSHNPTWSWASMKGAIQTQDRFLEKERCYYVKDHQGRPIEFELMDQACIAPKSGSHTWAEEFQIMDRRIAEMKNSKESTTRSIIQASELWRTIERKRDEEPKLRCKSLQIQGHLVGVRLRYIDSESKWMAEFPDSPSQCPSESTIEVFPDVKPKSEQIWLLLVLVATLHRRDENVFYDGFGIILQAASQECHYHRTGAFHFQDISATVWKRLQTTDFYCRKNASLELYDDVKGLKLWLD